MPTGGGNRFHLIHRISAVAFVQTPQVLLTGVLLATPDRRSHAPAAAAGTRQTELEEQFPSPVVCRWIGNSQQVAQKHYLQVTDDHYQRAVTAGVKSGAQVVQNATQHLHFSARTGSQGTSGADEKTPLLPVHAPGCESLQGRGVGDTGFEPVTSAV